MLARLIFALLLAAFAMPAVANGPCHDAPAAAVALHHGAHRVPHEDDRATAPHVCIGCIPPASLAARALAAPRVIAVVPRRIVATRFDPASGTPPALPPPRERA